METRVEQRRWAPVGGPMYRATQVCRLAGVTYRQLDYWVRTGVIVPIRESRGSGHERRFSARQVELVRRISRIRDAGLSLQRVRPLVPLLEAAPAGAWIVVPVDTRPAMVLADDHDLVAELALVGAAFVLEA